MKPMIIPVIHYKDDEQAKRNARLVADAGCNAVMFIHMEGDDITLVECAKRLKDEVSDLLVGINCLSLNADAALAVSTMNGFDMTWTDRQVTHSSLVDDHDGGDQSMSRLSQQLECHPGHMFFVGVAFKHQSHEPRPEIAANRALRLGMIPTTSGTATGVAADTSAIAALRSSIPSSAPLAIASGITPENVTLYAPYVTHILVSTGISSSFHELDAGRLTKLLEA